MKVWHLVRFEHSPDLAFADAEEAINRTGSVPIEVVEKRYLNAVRNSNKRMKQELKELRKSKGALMEAYAEELAHLRWRLEKKT